MRKLLIIFTAVMRLQAVTVYHVQASGGDFTAATIRAELLSNSACGKVYEFKSGESFDIAANSLYAPKITTGLHALEVCAHPPVLRSSECGSIGPRNGGSSDAAKMATITSDNITGTLITGTGAHSWVIKCLDIYNTADTQTVVMLQGQDASNSAFADNSLKGLIRHVNFSKNWVHGNAVSVHHLRSNNGVQGIVNNFRAEGNRIEDCIQSYDSDKDNQAFGISTSFNQLWYRNNANLCGVEKWIVGGSFLSVAGATGVIHVDGNYFHTPFRHRYTQGSGSPTANCSYGSASDAESYYDTSGNAWWLCQPGGVWTGGNQGSGDSPYNYHPLKNLFELKIARAGKFRGNVMDTMFYPTFAQQRAGGFVGNQSDTRCQTANPEGGFHWLEVDSNLISNTPSGFLIGSLAGTTGPCGISYTAEQDANDYISHIRVKNLVMRNIGNALSIRGWPAAGISVPSIGIQWTRAKHISFQHNSTFLNSTSPDGMPVSLNPTAFGVVNYGSIWNYKYLGAYGSGSGAFNWTTWSDSGQAQYASWGHDVIINDGSQNGFVYGAAQEQFAADMYNFGMIDIVNGRAMCRSCYFPATFAATGFVSHTDDGSSALTGEALDVSSAYKGKAGGRDPGADISRVNAMISCAVTGCKNPMLDFRASVRKIVTTSAELHYFAPSRSAAAVTVSVNANYSSPVFTDAGSVGIRSRNLSLTGLTANTHYFYKIVCDGLTIEGELVTL